MMERGEYIMLLTISSFLAFTIIVAIISYIKTKGSDSTAKGYFLAGRGLSATVIASSMVLTSLSTEQLVGVNGDSYASNFSIMAWTVVSIIPLIVLAVYLLPKYLKGGFTTIPEFFQERYDEKTRRLMSILFLIGYTFVMIPGSLYSGAIAFTKIFNVSEMFHLSFSASLWLVVWITGIIGGIYAIFGGLKAVAVSDTLNGIGLFIGGLFIPVFGLLFIGKGNVMHGLNIILTEHPEKLNAIGSASSSTPWTTIFTGILIVNFFYWSTNQAIVQRSLAAKNLAAGQKGILMAGVMLLLLPVILNLPGTIAYIVFGDSLAKADFAYPALVAKVLPKCLLGFFTATILGAILSTFNSFVNSAATLFCVDIYKPKIKPHATDDEMIKMAKIVSTIIALISMFIAPLLQYGSDGIFLILRRFAGFFNIPIVALVCIGFLNKTVSGKAARITVYLHIILYYSLVWVFKVNVNFTHIMGALFVFDVILMLVLSLKFKRTTPYVPNKVNKSNVALHYWKYSMLAGLLLAFALIYMYGVLSPIGIATKTPNGKFGMYSLIYWMIVLPITLVCHNAFVKKCIKAKVNEVSEIA
ncbi:symporter [Clostridium sp. K25]|nr:symporter [Clostridium sp. K25]